MRRNEQIPDPTLEVLNDEHVGANEVIGMLGADRARLVGGCVRDLIRGETPKDWDIATTHVPKETKRVLQNHGLQVIDTGIEYGTVTAVHGGRTYEITTLRKDVDTDGRRATVVEFSQDWKEDAQRRDFTMNALYLDAAGVVHDPLGSGLEDAREGFVRFIGDAEDRIREDYLRALRYYRFLARIGGRVDIISERAAARACATKLSSKVSGERQRDETLKMLVQPHAAAVAAMLFGTGYFGYDADPLRLSAMIETDRFEEPVSAVRRLAALAPSRTLVESFRLSKKDETQYFTLVSKATSRYSKEDVPHLCYEFGPELARDIVMMSQAEHRTYEREFDILDGHRYRDYVFPLQGADFIDLGMEEGPSIGNAMRKYIEIWRKSDMTLERDALLGMARREVDPSRPEIYSPWNVRGDKVGW